MKFIMSQSQSRQQKFHFIKIESIFVLSIYAFDMNEYTYQ